MVLVVDNIHTKKMTASSADIDMKANLGTFQSRTVVAVMLGNTPCKTYAMVLSAFLPFDSMTMQAHVINTPVRFDNDSTAPLDFFFGGARDSSRKSTLLLKRALPNWCKISISSSRRSSSQSSSSFTDSS